MVQYSICKREIKKITRLCAQWRGKVISGKLPNNTIWWLSTNGQKIWIESKDLEHDKFEEKGYHKADDRIFRNGKEKGELTTSRLESRRKKDAWVIKIETLLDVYPELIDEIKKKEIEEKKKKRSSKTKKDFRQKSLVSKNEILTMTSERKDSINGKHYAVNDKNIIINEKISENKKEYFDFERPYVTWIKDEINKSEKGEMIIPFKELKSKMGEDFEKMDDFRIYFGLNKILSNIGIVVELKTIKRESVAIIRKKTIDSAIKAPVA